MESNDELFNRIKARAHDPKRRNDLPSTGQGMTMAVGRAGGMKLMGLDFSSLLSGEVKEVKPEPSQLPSPADLESIEQVENQLGFSLPTDLRKMYLEIADGGFGPGAGILEIKQVAKTYLDMIKDPPGPRGQKWPPELLAITATNPGYDCIDRTTGKIIFWDEEELADGGSDKVWKRSFKAEAPSLASWFEKWLGELSPEERTQQMMKTAMENQIRQSLNRWRAKTPAERAAEGLPETGWEQVLFGHLGLDLDKL